MKCTRPLSSKVPLLQHPYVQEHLNSPSQTSKFSIFISSPLSSYLSFLFYTPHFSCTSTSDMEKTDQRETHDFMNVESFSQLPFIRPAPVKDKGIRLFGKEFGGDSTASEESDSAQTNAREEAKDGLDNGESTRKFECHYCCRNFPTSQALGGHQNAHKRERQHAKRAHLQSAMVHGGLAEAHVYGLMNYRLGAVPNPALAYQSWNKISNSYNTNSRFYSSHGSYSQPPINGSPLALWRIPGAAHSSPTFSRDDPMNHPLPLFANDELKPPQVSSASQARLGYESKPKMQDHVSLDLHL